MAVGIWFHYVAPLALVPRLLGSVPFEMCFPKYRNILVIHRLKIASLVIDSDVRYEEDGEHAKELL